LKFEILARNSKAARHGSVKNIGHGKTIFAARSSLTLARKARGKRLPAARLARSFFQFDDFNDPALAARTLKGAPSKPGLIWLNAATLAHRT
jgi:hypothetical protein